MAKGDIGTEPDRFDLDASNAQTLSEKNRNVFSRHPEPKRHRPIRLSTHVQRRVAGRGCVLSALREWAFIWVNSLSPLFSKNSYFRIGSEVRIVIILMFIHTADPFSILLYTWVTFL